MTFKWFKLSFVHENIVNAVIILVDICNNVIVSNDKPCYLMTKWLEHGISLSSVHLNIDNVVLFIVFIVVVVFCSL